MSRERREGNTRTEGDVSRPKRVPMHEQRNRLSLPKKKGWVRRWFLDRGDRLLRAKEAGYRLIERGEVPAVGDEQVRKTAIGVSSMAVSPASGNNEDVLVAMEIREEHYSEDAMAKQREIDEQEKDLFRQLNRGTAFNPAETDDGGLMYGQFGPGGKRVSDPADAKVFGARNRR